MRDKIEQSHTICHPETTNKLFIKFLNNYSHEKIVLQKNTTSHISEHLDKQSMMKCERTKLYKSLYTSSVIKMVDIAGNQRKRFVDCLFKEVQCNNDVMLIDDSIFSGHTLIAAKEALKRQILMQFAYLVNNFSQHKKRR